MARAVEGEFFFINSGYFLATAAFALGGGNFLVESETKGKKDAASPQSGHCISVMFGLMRCCCGISIGHIDDDDGATPLN
jgi:hypothetical protein